MGRRATKKVEEITSDADGNERTTLSSHHRFIYRGYLQIACCDLTRTAHPCLWLITWDPTQPVATRPLAIQKDGTWYTYGWDLTKNICEVFGQNGYIRTTYTYTPYGSVSANGDVTQPIQWGSEYADTDLALVYYNYRHYNPMDGRWLGRDTEGEEECRNLYNYCSMKVLNYCDILGKNSYQVTPCLYLMIQLITKGFWGESYSYIRNGATLRVNTDFHIIVRSIWKETEQCECEKNYFTTHFPYEIIARLKYGEKIIETYFRKADYRTVFGKVHKMDIALAQSTMTNKKGTNLYIESGGFSIQKKNLLQKSKLELNIKQVPGEFEQDLSYIVIYDKSIEYTDWNTHKVDNNK